MNNGFKVNFIIAGAAKCGTTALAKFLMQHPDVYLPPCKEVRYFSNDLYFKGSNPDCSEYHISYTDGQGRFFDIDRLYVTVSSGNSEKDVKSASLAEASAIGDATPMYMWWKTAPERIYNYNPDMKLIFLFRNPIERAFSHYHMLVRKKKERLPFSVAIRAESFRSIFRLSQLTGKAYAGRSRYAAQVKRMMKFFPRDQMLFLLTDDLRNHHKETLDKVFAFLGVQPTEIPAEEVYSMGERPAISGADVRYLWRKLKNDVCELERLTGLDCSSWKPRGL